MRQLRILIDADDTIEYLAKAWVKRLNETHNTNVNWKEVRQWDIGVDFPELTSEEVYAPLLDPDFWDTVEPMCGASEVIFQLQKEGH